MAHNLKLKDADNSGLPTEHERRFKNLVQS